MLSNDVVLFRFTGPFGIPVEIGQSIVFLLGLLIFLNLGSDVTYGIILAAIILVSIFLHELGHAWGCRVQGVPVRRIMLHGGGGFCEHSGRTTTRQQELIIAMGPLVNLALWAIGGLIGYWMMSRIGVTADGFVMPTAPYWKIMFYIEMFAWINLLLFAFNLLPVQPLDGGKLFQLALLRSMPPMQAHKLTGAVGLIVSIAWIPAMVWLFVTYGFVLFYIPSIASHYRMMKGELG